MRERTLDLRRGYATSFPPNQVNDSNKGSNGPAGSRSGKLHSEERDGLSVTGRSPATQSPVKDPRVNSHTSQVNDSRHVKPPWQIQVCWVTLHGQ